jgi:hypothetical protein
VLNLLKFLLLDWHINFGFNNENHLLVRPSHSLDVKLEFSAWISLNSLM